MKLAICLVVCMVAAAHAAIPGKFQRAGAPSEVRGAWAGPLPGGGVESGIQGSDSQLSYTVVTGRKHEYSYGRTLSHECTGMGRYKAITEYTSVSLTGKLSKYRVCEIGHVDLAAGIYRWNDSREECPKTLKYVLTRSSPWEAATSYSCK